MAKIKILRKWMPKQKVWLVSFVTSSPTFINEKGLYIPGDVFNSNVIPIDPALVESVKEQLKRHIKSFTITVEQLKSERLNITK